VGRHRLDQAKHHGVDDPQIENHLMGASNAQVAALLRSYAATLALEGVDRFKVKAYHRAAETLETTQDKVASLVANGESLQKLPGIGAAISKKIEEIVRTGSLPQLERSLARLSPELAELAARPGLDAKKVLRVYKKLGIGTLEALQARLESGEIREVFGPRLEFTLRQGLDDRPRWLLWAVDKMAPAIESFLTSPCGAARVARLGSLRRKQETVGDLGFLVAGESAATIFKRFAEFGAVQSAEIGKHEALYRLSERRAVKLVWSTVEHWGLALLQHTGSKAHLAELAVAAKKQRLTLAGKSLGSAAADETKIYARLKLPFIPPELREGRGEVAVASRDELPVLLEVDDLRGDLHMHTAASDGADTLADMAKAAAARGYQYIAVTDHSQSLKIANGLTEERLRKHIKAIDRLNVRLNGITLLKSAEVDILADGRLDYSDSILKELDLTVCSIHSRFGLNKEQQTERILRAMDNRYFSILGHPTGRLLLTRAGYEIDLPRIIEHAKTVGCFFEINSSPKRLDLSDEDAKMARDAGIQMAINTDAHSVEELRFISAGVNQARRAWLSKADVLNALPLAKLKKVLRR
jgi:DNA polymerase (family X)